MPTERIKGEIMSKPIEEGCRAVIVNSEAGNNGTVVSVLKSLGEHNYGGGEMHHTWEVDIVLIGKATIDNRVPEFQLKRIDYDGDETTTWEAMKDIWTPEIEVA